MCVCVCVCYLPSWVLCCECVVHLSVVVSESVVKSCSHVLKRQCQRKASFWMFSAEGCTCIHAVLVCFVLTFPWQIVTLYKHRVCVHTMSLLLIIITLWIGLIWTADFTQENSLRLLRQVWNGAVNANAQSLSLSLSLIRIVFCTMVQIFTPYAPSVAPHGDETALCNWTTSLKATLMHSLACQTTLCTCVKIIMPLYKKKNINWYIRRYELFFVAVKMLWVLLSVSTGHPFSLTVITGHKFMCFYVGGWW